MKPAGGQASWMSLRDCFALAAMQAMVTRSPQQVSTYVDNLKMTVADHLSKEAYIMADAMLKERGS